jgi:hypothetical protein
MESICLCWLIPLPRSPPPSPPQALPAPTPYPCECAMPCWVCQAKPKIILMMLHVATQVPPSIPSTSPKVKPSHPWGHFLHVLADACFQVPPSLSSIQGLASLDLRGTQLRAYPPFLGQLTGRWVGYRVAVFWYKQGGPQCQGAEVRVSMPADLYVTS